MQLGVPQRRSVGGGDSGIVPDQEGERQVKLFPAKSITY